MAGGRQIRIAAERFRPPETRKSFEKAGIMAEGTMAGNRKAMERRKKIRLNASMPTNVQHRFFLELAEKLRGMRKDSIERRETLDEMGHYACAYVAFERDSGLLGDIGKALMEYEKDTRSVYAAAMFAEAAGNAFERAGMKAEAKKAYLQASGKYKIAGENEFADARELQRKQDNDMRNIELGLKHGALEKIAKSDDMDRKARSCG